MLMPPNVSVSALVKFPGVVGLRGRRGLVWGPVETVICVFAFIVTQEPNECSVFVVCWHQNIPKHSTNREQNYTTPNLTTDLFINLTTGSFRCFDTNGLITDSPLFRRLVLGHKLEAASQGVSTLSHVQRLSSCQQQQTTPNNTQTTTVLVAYCVSM